MEDSKSRLPWEAYNNFFKLLKTFENGNFSVSCLNCLGKTLSVSKTSPTNMKIHIERKHGHLLKKLIKDIEDSKKSGKQTTLFENSSRQPSLIEFQRGAKTSTAEEVETDLLDWIVDGLHPFSEVERPSFVKLWSRLTNRKLICRTTLMKRLEDKFKTGRQKLMEELEEVNYVCTAADSWSCFRRAFLGVTVHWIDPKSYERRNAALACKRIIGSQTSEVLAKELSEIFSNFTIQNKNEMTVTDNGSNFVKAFKIFGNDSAATEQESLSEENEGNVEFLSLTDALNRVESYTCGVNLPDHRRCAAHTLNLIAVHDSEAALQNGSYKKVHRSTFAKCQSIWNKSRGSAKCADKVREKLGVNLIVPNATRWNSLFDSTNQLASFFPEKEDKVHSLCDVLGLSRLNTAEIQFMQEYVEVMRPLAKSLDILQGDKNISVGYLLPTLTKLEEYIDISMGKPLSTCRPLALAVKEGIRKRFSADFEDRNLLLAACFHPRFKLNWLKEPKAGEAKEAMRAEVEKLIPPQQSHVSPLQEFDGFFSFEPKKEGGSEELRRFLEEDLAPFSSIANYKLIKKLSIRYNTPLPSSASVERLFSCAKDVFQSRRSRLTDENFEKQLILKFASK